MKTLRGSRDPTHFALYNSAKDSYEILLKQHENYWKQREKQFWLQRGDQNTRYFHLMAISRRKKNTISQLKDQSGSWFDWENGLSDLIVNYYNNLFKTQQGPFSVITDIVDRKVSDEINEDLKRPFKLKR